MKKVMKDVGQFMSVWLAWSAVVWAFVWWWLLIANSNSEIASNDTKCTKKLDNLDKDVNNSILLIKNEVKSDVQKLCAGYDNLTWQEELRLITADNRIFRIIKDKWLFEEKLELVKK